MGTGSMALALFPALINPDPGLNWSLNPGFFILKNKNNFLIFYIKIKK